MTGWSTATLFVSTGHRAPPTVPPMVPTRLWTNADFTTLDPAQPRARAVVTMGPTIRAVGGNEIVDTWRARADEVIELGGRSVVPGFTDSHIHLLAHGLTMSHVALERCDSPDAVVAALRGADHPAEGWIVGTGFQVNRWPEGSAPHRALLDEHFAERPVLLHSRCHHQVWVNSAALRAAGLTAATDAPAGGVIVRDASGEPTGVLQEEAIDLATRAMPPPSEAQRRAALQAATRDLWQHGVVATHVPESRECLETLTAMHRDGALRMRTLFLPPFAMAEELVASERHAGEGDPWLRLGALKVLIDGALGSATALMHEPHEGQPGNVGVEVIAADRLREMVEFAHAHRWPMAIHAIGDRAVDVAVDTLAASQTRHGVTREAPGGWDRIEHFQVFAPGTPARTARARIGAMMQPIHLFDDWAPAERLWGDRAARAYACRSLLAAGVPVALGSDAPVASINPFENIHAAVTRTDLDGKPAGGWHIAEALDVQAALEALCATPARLAGEANERGRIAPGLAADFVALSGDPWATDGDWRAVRADLTIVAGAVAHDRHGERAVEIENSLSEV